jgi:hypothetical protein
VASLVKINGVQAVLKALDKSDNRIAVATARGLKKAGLFLQRESQKLVPVDTGNLKNSAFTRATGKGFDTEVIVGFTAEYAIYVHEAVGMKLKGQPRRKKGSRGSFWDPQGRAQAKFLEEPARRLQKQLGKIVADEASKA